MSLLVTTFVPEGIILAGDSRLTLNWTEKNATTNSENFFSITASDSNAKIFTIKEKFGLGTYGAASINGIPIAGYINQFIEEKIDDKTEIDDIPKSLHEFFGNTHGKPNTSFYLAGYKIENRISIPHVYQLNINTGATQRINIFSGAVGFGANWGGEHEILLRLLKDIKIEDGGTLVDLKSTNIPFEFFTLQDAVDFSNYAVRVTIETFRFQRRIKTVGGPIDILSITPAGTAWVKRKKLSGDD